MRTRLVGLLAVASLLMLALPAWAAHTDKAMLSLMQPATIGAIKLAPGNYQLEVAPGGHQLAVYHNGQRLGTLACHWFQLQQKPSQTEVLLTKRRVEQVRFSGKTMAVRVGRSSGKNS